MEIRILIFVAFTCATIVINTLLIFGLYKTFAGLANKVDSTVSEFQKNGEVKEWLDSLQSASAQAVLVTQATKEQIAEFEPAITRAQESYKRSLAQIDTTLERVADQINTNVQKAQDAVAKPAFSVMAFAAGLTRLFGNTKAEDE